MPSRTALRVRRSAPHAAAKGGQATATESAMRLPGSLGTVPAVLQRQSIPGVGELADRASGWGERQWERAERYRDKAADLAGRGADHAGDLAERASQGAEGWWDRGAGDITRIDFDGAEVKVSGQKSATYKAVSGLMPPTKDPKEIDYTRPEYQNIPDKGPIPEGSYYLDPAEVESNPPGKFNKAAWGQYRTRLHETLSTNIWRRATTERTGGFYLHQDANHNGTAGCVGLWNTKDNAAIHAMIKATSAQIPVYVKYKAAAAPAFTPGITAAPVQRAAATDLIQREPETTPKKTKPHYLVAAGISRINADQKRYKAGAFPSDYYDSLARHLFEVALRKNGRNYSAAFATLDNLQWNKFGSGLQNHYTRIVGTDSANGWDKFRHFVLTAYLQCAYSGVLAPEVFTYGKELYDEAEHLVGKDPEGYSVPDIRADNKGEKFAEEMAGQCDRERMAAAKRAAYRALNALVDPRTYGARL